MLLNTKTVFITGAAGGIGAAFVQALLQRGANVIIADIDEKSGTQLVEKFSKEFGKDKVAFIKCDVGNIHSFQEAFEAAVSKYKAIDIMVNNAGILDEKDLDKLFRVNLKGTIDGTELALAHMRKDSGGQGGIIINVSSQLGYEPAYIAPTYTATKHGVIGYTRSLATAPDVSKQGVRFACLCPGITDTAIYNGPWSTKFRDGYLSDVESLLSADMIKPETVAEGLLSLIDDDDSNNTVMSVSLEKGVKQLQINVNTV